MRSVFLLYLLLFVSRHDCGCPLSSVGYGSFRSIQEKLTSLLCSVLFSAS